MHRSTLALPLTLCTFLVPACNSSAPDGNNPDWNNRDALAAESVEIQLDENARPVEVEYHILPAAVPANVMAAMDELHPGGRAVEAEKEFVGGVLYWEVTKEIDGLEIEAMFRVDGKLHSEELEVLSADVPEAVQQAVRERLGGSVNKWEEIRNGQRDLVEYHAKVAADGMRYKIMLSPTGVVRGIVREIPAEIEVPLP